METGLKLVYGAYITGKRSRNLKKNQEWCRFFVNFIFANISVANYLRKNNQDTVLCRRFESLQKIILIILF